MTNDTTLPTRRILHRWTGAVLWEGPAATVKDALHAAIAAGSNLSGSNLSGSDLRGSDLRDSDLRDSDLSGSNLSGSDLRGSDLRDSDLSGSNLTPIRDDFWAVLSSAPAEVPALIQALKEGKVDGSTYTGECACLVGTIANARHCSINDLGPLKPAPSRPAEMFFLAIRPGQTPENHEPSRLAVEWAEDWWRRMLAAFSPTV